jgi:hypothetical protein
MWPLVAGVARIVGPKLLMRGAGAVLKSPVGRAGVGGFMVGKAVGRNQEANQGLRDGGGMGNWFPGSTDGNGTMY